MAVITCGHPEKPHASKGLCMACYHISRRRDKGIHPPKIARINECGHPDRKHVALGMCPNCYDKHRWHGDRKTNNLAKAKERYYRVGNKELRAFNLSQWYGITQEDYDKMLKAQNNLCAICNKPETTKFKGKLKILSVDHDHETGQVRGLLCNACNHMLGNGKDDTTTLRSAIQYLQLSKGMPAKESA